MPKKKKIIDEIESEDEIIESDDQSEDLESDENISKDDESDNSENTSKDDEYDVEDNIDEDNIDEDNIDEDEEIDGESEDEYVDIDDDDDNNETDTSVFYEKKNENLLDMGLEYLKNNDKFELKNDKRQTAARLSKYEMVRILGERTKHLTMGAKPMVKNYESLSYEKIAEEELKLNMIPFKIKRTLPNGNFEIWTLDELFKDHLLSQLD